MSDSQKYKEEAQKRLLEELIEETEKQLMIENKLEKSNFARREVIAKMVSEDEGYKKLMAENNQLKLDNEKLKNLMSKELF